MRTFLAFLTLFISQLFHTAQAQDWFVEKYEARWEEDGARYRRDYRINHDTIEHFKFYRTEIYFGSRDQALVASAFGTTSSPLGVPFSMIADDHQGVHLWEHGNGPVRMGRLTKYSPYFFEGFVGEGYPADTFDIFMFHVDTSATLGIIDGAKIYMQAISVYNYHYSERNDLPPVSVEKVATDNALTVYPSPARGHIRLKYPQVGQRPLVYHIYNVKGQLIARGSAGENTNINVAFLAPGAYMVGVDTGKGRMYQKFIKQ